MTSMSPVGDMSVVTLIRTDTTLDRSQKDEKVYVCVSKNLLSPKGSCVTGRVGIAMLH
jgi:hypothetical protein